ncbi:MAG: helix-turn-helix transcriptional regulator [Oscillospiraceae bacterium]|nr:helix-turn-helix transcriptional regulator [Oscillospiraceae bacterium]MBQ8927013.1 helix-turn-helix transcriptional regulator [Oscillospiraceae bacterium]
MITSNEVCLIACGQQAEAGEMTFRSEKEQEYLLVMCGIRTTLTIDGKQFQFQPFTYVMYPLRPEGVSVHSEGMTAYRYMQLRFTDRYLKRVSDQVPECYEVHTLAQPLAIEEIWKILLPAMERTGHPELGIHALHLFLCLLMESSDGTVTRAAEVPHYDKLTALRHRIYSHPAESWYIQDICDELGISRPYFHKIYLAAFGTTCTQDVIASRIAYSKRLLETTDAAIASVSQQCGFETDVYFMRQFKRHVGMTPTAYRRVYRQSAVKAGR